VVELGEKYKVEPSTEFIHQVGELLGIDKMKIK
jgi:DNA polymerase III subunit alpha